MPEIDHSTTPLQRAMAELRRALAASEPPASALIADAMERISRAIGASAPAPPRHSEAPRAEATSLIEQIVQREGLASPTSGAPRHPHCQNSGCYLNEQIEQDWPE